MKKKAKEWTEKRIKELLLEHGELVVIAYCGGRPFSYRKLNLLEGSKYATSRYDFDIGHLMQCCWENLTAPVECRIERMFNYDRQEGLKIRKVYASVLTELKR